MKQYGMIVFSPKTLQSPAYYAVWDDPRDTLQEVIAEADELEQANNRGGVLHISRPEAIFEYDTEAGTFTTATSKPALARLLSDMEDGREQNRRDDLPDAERRAEDRESRAEYNRQVEKDMS